MNVALPALIVFLLLLPGFVFRTRLKRAERTALDYSPFGQVVTEAFLWAVVVHMLWLFLSYLVVGRALDPEILLKLLSSDAMAQTKATEGVAKSFGAVSSYFVTLLFASYAIPSGVRSLISKYRLDRDGIAFGSIFRFHQAPWYYLLTSAAFATGDEPDLIVVSAIVEIGGEAVLYTGVLAEFFVNSEGQLDRIVLQAAMRRPIKLDKNAAAPEASHRSSRFYPIDGDYFVLRYSETITLNVEYLKLTPANRAPGESE